MIILANLLKIGWAIKELWLVRWNRSFVSIYTAAHLVRL